MASATRRPEEGDGSSKSKWDITRDLIKAKLSNPSTRREYQRMKREKEIKKMQENMPRKTLDNSVVGSARSRVESAHVDPLTSLSRQGTETKITSFPIPANDEVDGVQKTDRPKHLEVKEHPGHKHGSRLCMISAVVHMKCMMQRKPKSIQELRKNPVTTQQEKSLHGKNKNSSYDSDSDESDHEPLGYMHKVRYLRGTRENTELSIDEIFQ